MASTPSLPELNAQVVAALADQAAWGGVPPDTTDLTARTLPEGVDPNQHWADVGRVLVGLEREGYVTSDNTGGTYRWTVTDAGRQEWGL